MKVVIIAGGKGTRLKEIAGDVPKPMVPVAGKPILEYQIELAKRYGYADIIILTGHLGEQIEAYFGNGSRWGVNITYYQEPAPLSTAGCVKEIEPLLTEDFFLFYGDTIMDISLARMAEFHRAAGAVATLFLHPNDHPADSDLVDVDDNDIVQNFYPKPHGEGYYRNLVNAALYILTPQVLNYIEKGVSADFGKHIFPRVLKNNIKIAGYISPEYIKDMGTPDRLKKVAGDILSGKVSRLNIENKRPAVFLDRDGVINREVDLLCQLTDFELLPNAAAAIKKINQAGYLAVVVTNQPVIARNLVSFAELRALHNKMESLLGAQGAYIDALYFCPHHPDSGYPEERKEYKVKCRCRKPSPGMLLAAQEQLNIDLPNSYIIGDRASDILAGRAAGVKTIIVKSNGEIEYNGNPLADHKCDDILSAVELILDEKG